MQVLHEVVELADQAVEMFLFSVGASDPLRCLQILGWGPLRLPGETERWETARSSARESLSARPIEGIDVAAIHTNAAEGQARAERALAAGVAGRMSTPDTGLLKSEQVRPDEARAAWQHAIKSGHPELAPKAWNSLGMLEYEQGQTGEARAAWQHAADSGHPDHAPKAWNSLGILESEQVRPDEARAAWHHAIDSGHPDHAPKAWINLGILEYKQGRPDEARAAWQHAIDSGHPDHAPKAWNNLRRPTSTVST